jgi:CIC family chloride channel protein
MGAYFAAIVRALPLTGIVLMVEMTDPYVQILPLFVTCFAAYPVAVHG